MTKNDFEIFSTCWRFLELWPVLRRSLILTIFEFLRLSRRVVNGFWAFLESRRFLDVHKCCCISFKLRRKIAISKMTLKFLDFLIFSLVLRTCLKFECCFNVFWITENFLNYLSFLVFWRFFQLLAFLDASKISRMIEFSWIFDNFLILWNFLEFFLISFNFRRLEFSGFLAFRRFVDSFSQFQAFLDVLNA